jgi:hypothetical protein
MIELLFRFIMYVIFGLSLEIIFSVTGIERILGIKLNKPYPQKYLVGFVSLYMIPVHGFGLLFGFELAYKLISDWNIIWRYLFWCMLFTAAEIFWGWLMEKTVGFFPWDYYKESKYRFPKNGYSSYTLIPLWGIAGLVLEFYSNLMIQLSPYVKEIILEIIYI